MQPGSISNSPVNSKTSITHFFDNLTLCAHNFLHINTSASIVVHSISLILTLLFHNPRVNGFFIVIFFKAFYRKFGLKAWMYKFEFI